MDECRQIIPTPLSPWKEVSLFCLSFLFLTWFLLCDLLWPVKCEQKSHPDESLSLPMFGSLAHSPLVMEVMSTQVHAEVPEDGSQLGILKIPGEAPISIAGFM